MAEVKLDLDPKKIIQALTDAGDEVKELARTVETALGKQAPESIGKFEKAAEKGSNDISAYFRNLGKRVKEDLKTVFDIGGVMGGLKLGQALSQGVKEVFDLEKAFDRLNTRLGLSGKAYQDFRRELGSKVASTGQKLEDIMPGVETAASKGGVKSASQLSSIGEALGKARAATGESTESLSDTIVEILKTQGKQVNATTFKQTLDALQATRVTGAFKTAGDAGAAIEGISPYAKQFGMSTREMGGMAATASRAGGAGNDILKQLIDRAAQAGGGTALNSILGQNIFKVGKEGQTTGINAGALGKIDMKRFGGMSQNVLESATGIHGAAGADLARFVDAFKNGMGDYQKVVKGANETQAQFKTATNNLASGLDQFKEKTKNAGREVGDALSTAGKQFMSKDFKGALESLKGGGKALLDNKEVLGGALGVTALGAIMAGKGASGLLSKVPGGGILGGEMAKAAGIQPVYVTNAGEIGGGVAGGLGKLGMFGAVAAGGIAAGSALSNTTVGKKVGNAMNPVIDSVFKAFDVGGTSSAQKDLEEAQKRSKERYGGGGGVSPADLKKAVADGFVEGHTKVNKDKKPQFSNPSRPPGVGSGM